MDDLVPDRPLACEPTGDDGRTVRVCVVLPPDGNPVVLHDRCPHRDIRLSGGVVRDGELVCPGHFWRFDVRTGHRTDAVSGGVTLHESRIVDGCQGRFGARVRGLGQRGEDVAELVPPAALLLGVGEHLRVSSCLCKVRWVTWG